MYTQTVTGRIMRPNAKVFQPARGSHMTPGDQLMIRVPCVNWRNTQWSGRDFFRGAGVKANYAGPDRDVWYVARSQGVKIITVMINTFGTVELTRDSRARGRACGISCQDARGLECSCQCGGVNHGLGGIPGSWHWTCTGDFIIEHTGIRRVAYVLSK